MMRSLSGISGLLIAGLGAGLISQNAMAAFNSGSTGADGAFSPTASIQLELPPSGIFNFTTVNIPSGVTVTFKKNATNTPVVILASGNVTIAGSVNVSGSASTNVGAAGDGNLADDGLPGKGGPGGYDGGYGAPAGYSFTNYAGSGHGPGGGGGGRGAYINGSWYAGGGGGGGFGGTGSNGANSQFQPGVGGPAYGSSLLLPLIGGSGGGGGSGGSHFGGSGGGGGGGAILIASSGTVNITGSIYASGGSSGASSGAGAGGRGGAGSGGAIRIVATTIAGNGTISATGATSNGAAGSGGRIRLEAENFTRTAGTSPSSPAIAAPGLLFVPGLPSLKIASVAGVAAPEAPTGNADITLPADTTNPVTVTFATSGVPTDSVIKLTVVPVRGLKITATSEALAGTEQSATASVSVTLPSGPSTLTASTSYTVTAALGDSLSTFAKGERVERIELAAAANGASTVTLITVSGKKYRLPSSVIAGMPG